MFDKIQNKKLSFHRSIILSIIFILSCTIMAFKFVPNLEFDHMDFKYIPNPNYNMDLIVACVYPAFQDTQHIDKYLESTELIVNQEVPAPKYNSELADPNVNYDDFNKAKYKLPKPKGGYVELIKKINSVAPLDFEGSKKKLIMNMYVLKNGDVWAAYVFDGSLKKELHKNVVEIIKDTKFQPGTDMGNPINSRSFIKIPLSYNYSN